jgi:thiol-disulfide isomerase/thioredoxin
MPAPALSMAPLEGGAPVSLAGLKGSVVYVDFWASWCVPCRLSMPALEDLYKRNKSRGFAVVGVNKDAGVADARRFLAKVPVSFTLVQDGADAAARGFDVKAMPSGYLVDRKGLVRQVHRGFTAETGATLEKEIDSLLKEPS